jgi:hypothetical protein
MVGMAAGEDTTVTVFVDDAVEGRLPAVCARNATSSDGVLVIRTTVGERRSAVVPLVALVAALVLVRPLGWGAVALLALALPWLVTRARPEQLRVQVPWSVAAEQRADVLRRRQRTAWGLAGAGVVGLVASIVARSAGGAGGQPGMTTKVGFAALLLATTVAVASGWVASWRLGRHTVGVGLDASRRWVTLRNVHPAFARAVRARTNASRPRDTEPQSD